MKQISLTLLVTLALTLTACGASASTAPATASETSNSSGNLSGPAMIILGSLKLDGTPQAITQQEAKDLLPLWQVYQEISTSDTAAQEEIDALVKQIEETMTPAQMTAIKGMNLTSQDSFAIMQQLGLGIDRGQSGSSSSGNNGNSQSGNGNTFFIPGGGSPGEGGNGSGTFNRNSGGGSSSRSFSGGPGFGGQDFGGQGFSPEQQATAQASRAQRGGGNFLTSGLLNALIQYLEKVSGNPAIAQGTPQAAPHIIPSTTPTP